MDEKSDNFEKEKEARTNASSLISIIFSPLFEIISGFLPWLKKSNYAWYLLSVIILLISIKLNWVNLFTSIIILICTLILECISLNLEFFKKFLKDDSQDKINQFLNNILTKS